MDQIVYWLNKHTKYNQEEWIKKPTIFATQAIEYLPRTGKLLDLGAGQGQDSIYFADHGFDVTATDFSQFALDKITDSRINKQIIDLSKPLAITVNSFDVVYSHLALHYFDLSRTKALFEEIFNILKPGGVLATLVNTTDDPEVNQSQRIEEDLYITPSDLQKRFFSTKSIAQFTSKFETLLLDNKGETHKDEIKTLVRYIGRKPKDS